MDTRDCISVKNALDTAKKRWQKPPATKTHISKVAPYSGMARSWKPELDWKKLVIAAVAFAIISQVVHTIGAFFSMNYYTNPAYFSLWSQLMMPNNGPPGMEFYVLSILFAFVSGLIFSYLYTRLAGSVSATTFGLLLFLVSGVPSYLAMFLLFAAPTMLLVAWVVEGLLVYILGGLAIANLLK